MLTGPYICVGTPTCTLFTLRGIGTSPASEAAIVMGKLKVNNPGFTLIIAKVQG